MLATNSTIPRRISSRNSIHINKSSSSISRFPLVPDPRRLLLIPRASSGHPPSTVSSPHQQQQQQEGCSHQQALSSILLLNENLKRQTGRALLKRDELLRGVELLADADFAAIIINSSGSSSSSSSRSGAAEAGLHVVYANRAGTELILADKQQQQQHPLMLTQMPVEVVGMLTQLQHSPVGHTPQQQQQQHLCRLLRNIRWAPHGCDSSCQQQQQQGPELSIQELLCVLLMSPNDAPFGLALLCDSWTWSDGALGVPGHTYVQQREIPDDITLQAAADAVRLQADAVRELKAGQGLNNTDPAVTAAVAELQRLKAQLSDIERLQRAFAAGRTSQLHHIVQAVHSSGHS